jgi:hypothetical protein
LERNYIKTDEDSVFTGSHAEFLVSLSIDQSFKCLSKLVHVTGTLENLNLPDIPTYPNKIKVMVPRQCHPLKISADGTFLLPYRKKMAAAQYFFKNFFFKSI